MADITDFSGGGGVGQEYKVEGVTKGEIFNDYTNNVASGIHSFAAGEGTMALTTGAAAFGKFNVLNSNNIFSVGIGTETSARTDAFFIDTTGNGTISNNFTVGNNLTVSGNTVVTGSVTASAFILPSTPSNEVGAVWLV